jgi:hypothetical protein
MRKGQLFNFLKYNTKNVSEQIVDKPPAKRWRALLHLIINSATL